MKFINHSGQSVDLGDIDLHITYLEDLSPQDISLDAVKKSRNFRQMVFLGHFTISQHGDSTFEKNLKKQEGKFAHKIAEETKEEEGEMESGLKVKIRGHFLEAGGYAKVNRNLALALKNKGKSVCIVPTTQSMVDLSTEELNEILRLKKDVGRDCIAIDSMIPSFGNMSGGKYKILYTTVESDTIPQQFIDCLNMYHEIWVTSDYCKEVIDKYVNKKVIVMPNSVDNMLYREDVEPYEFNPELNPFVFVSVFGWSYRKGYDVLLRAYLEEFSDQDNVSLLILSRYQGKTSRSDKIKDTINDYKQKYSPDNSPHIARISKVIPEKDMPRIYKACNAFALFSRGEGWGLPYCEASLCGLPVIATNHSGHTMFLNENNSVLVDIDKKSKLPPGLMHIHYWDNQIFPELKSDDFVYSCRKAMRYVYDNHGECVDKNKVLSQYISDNYNINTVSDKIISRLEEIWRDIK